MSITPENEARLYVADSDYMAYAACALNCWAGSNADQIRVETPGHAICFVVDKTWCEQVGPLLFTAPDGTTTDMCPLDAVQMVPTPLLNCRGYDCQMAPAVQIDDTENPVTVTVTASPSDTSGTTYRIEWGFGQTADAGVAAGQQVAHSYSAEGLYTVRVYPEDGGQEAGPFPVLARQVIPPVTVNNPGAQVNALGDLVNMEMSATTSPAGGTLTWSAVSLPVGLSLDPVFGSISGTVTKGQLATPVSVQAMDGAGHTASANFLWTVTTSVTVAAVPDQSWTSGTAISDLTLSATDDDSTLTAFTWSVEPGLPAGVGLNGSTAVISGTPAAATPAGAYTLTATDALGASGSTTLTATVTNTVEIVPVPDQSWSSGAPITDLELVAADSDASQTSFTWAVSPSLPSGVVLHTGTGVISGTPASPAATATYTVSATDFSGAVGTTPIVITVS